MSDKLQFVVLSGHFDKLKFVGHVRVPGAMYFHPQI